MNKPDLNEEEHPWENTLVQFLDGQDYDKTIYLGGDFTVENLRYIIEWVESGKVKYRTVS